MRITTISVTYCRTHNLGNYSSVKAEFQLAAELDQDEELGDEACRALWGTAKRNVKAQIQAATGAVEVADRMPLGISTYPVEPQGVQGRNGRAD